MTKHYQGGYIRFATRKSVPSRWEFLWRENNETGMLVRRTIVIGTVEKYPTVELANAAINRFRLQLNSKRSRLTVSQPLVTISDLIDHYIQVELSPLDNWRSHATRKIYKYFLERWIRPRWGTEPITCIRTVAIESWLRQLHRTNGEILANATKAKIRNIFSVIFNHAIRYEWLEQGKNPVTLVRQSATRRSDPQVLDYGEIQALLGQLSGSARLMVMLAVTTGLRRSELFALKWRDIDLGTMMVSVQRSVYLGMIGNCKTETSRRPVPLEPRVAADLWIWKETSKYNNPDDWIFASKAKEWHVLMLGVAGPAVAQNNGVQQPSARQQIQQIHAPQSIDQELARLTKDLELTPQQQQQVRPLLDEHHDRIQALLDKNPTASRQELGPQIHAISDDTHSDSCFADRSPERIGEGDAATRA